MSAIGVIGTVVISACFGAAFQQIVQRRTTTLTPAFLMVGVVGLAVLSAHLIKELVL